MSFCQWKEDWPEVARWAVPVWSACALAIGVGGWGMLRRDRSSYAHVAALAPAPIRPSWQEQAAAVAKNFPADVELWRQSALLLSEYDRAASRRLIALADQVSAGAVPMARSRSAQLRELAAGIGNSFTEAQMASAASSAPALAADYAGCLLIQNRWNEALTWIESLAPAIRSERRICELRAEACCHLGNWDGLRAQLASGVWGGKQSDAVNLAVGACIAAQRGRTGLRHSLWQAAIEACGSDAKTVRVVLRIALAFGLDEEVPGSFRALLRLDPSDKAVASEFKIWSQMHGSA